MIVARFTNERLYNIDHPYQRARLTGRRPIAAEDLSGFFGREPIGQVAHWQGTGPTSASRPPRICASRYHRHPGELPEYPPHPDVDRWKLSNGHPV